MTQQTVNVRGFKAAILTMSFIQMATNAAASILADIAAEFPAASVSAVQYLMTFPNLMVVGVSMIAARLAERISKRTIAATGLIFAAAAGILSFCFHFSLLILYLWAGMLGMGAGLVVPMANSLISDYFEGSDRDAMLGYQTGAANAGSMAMTYLGGMLAAVSWYMDYLVYLLALPGLFLTIRYVPKQNIKQEDALTERKAKITLHKSDFCFCIVAAVYMLMFYLGPTNIALFLKEKQIGDTMTAGTASALILFGGMMMGMLFGKLAGKIGRHTITLGFFMLFAGYMLIFGKEQILWIYLGCFLLGTSNPLVMPQCMGGVVSEDKRRSTVLMSVVFAVANLGTFFAPGLTAVSRMVMHTDTAVSRFVFAGIVTGGLTVLSAVVIQANQIMEKHYKR